LPGKLRQLIQINRTTELWPFAAPMTRTTSLIWLSLMWMAISAILTDAFVGLFQ
jgi:hypothetical protein